MRLPLLLLALLAAPVLSRDAWQVVSALEADGFKPVPFTATASSTLCEGKGAKRTCHEARRLSDADPATAWCEGAKGSGEKESLTLAFDAELTVGGLELVPFYGRSFKVARANARPRRVTVLAGGVGATVELEDPVAVVERENRPEGASAEDGPCGDETCASRDERLASMRVAFALPSPVKAKALTLRIDEVYGGGRYPDLCVAELKVLGKR